MFFFFSRSANPTNFKNADENQVLDALFKESLHKTDDYEGEDIEDEVMDRLQSDPKWGRKLLKIALAIAHRHWGKK